MDELDSYEIIPREPKSELQKFAAWFHQDWTLIFPGFPEGAEMYLSSISAPRKQRLSNELKRFIDSNSHLNDLEILDEWFKLGAHAWQPDLDILPTLIDFLRLMEKSGSADGIPDP